MKAALLTGVQSVELREVPQPELPEGGLIVKVETCAICGTDVKMYKYGYSAVELPFIPGHEFAGVVAESNAADIGYPEGERVTVNPNIPCGTCFYCQRGLQTACDDLRIIEMTTGDSLLQTIRYSDLGHSSKVGVHFIMAL